MNKNYLKYYKLIRDYTKLEHSLRQTELDMIIFLYDEPVFTQAKFYEHSLYISLHKRWLDELVDKGLIVVHSARNKYRKTPKTYSLSRRARSIVKVMYERLEGRSMADFNGPIYRKDIKSKKSVLIKQIYNMNRDLKIKKKKRMGYL